MAPLVLAFYLAPSLEPAADAIALGLERRVGHRVVFDRDATDDERRRQLDRDEAGITWLCGLETMERRQAGRLDVEVVAAPVFPGEARAVYHSVVVVPASSTASSLPELEGATVAVNQPSSWSGHHALRALLADEGLGELKVARVLVTGSHRASIDALLAGRADVAAIDHTAWAARCADDPHTAGLRVLARTPDWPAPPFSVSRSLAPSLRVAIRDALLALQPPGLEAIVPAADTDYAPMLAAAHANNGQAWPW